MILMTPEPGESAVPPADVKSDLNSRKITVTFIQNKTGANMRRVDMTLRQLAEHIGYQTAASKMELPWLKLALFGTKRKRQATACAPMKTRCRSAASKVTTIAETCRSTMRCANHARARPRCMLYTSAQLYARAQGTLANPGAAVAEAMHAGDAAKALSHGINGLLDGMLAGESFTLSLSYLYGHVHRSQSTALTCSTATSLDLRDDL